jgi:hypothetical protein
MITGHVFKLLTFVRKTSVFLFIRLRFVPYSLYSFLLLTYTCSALACLL